MRFAILKLSVKNIWAHKMRSVLTTLGIMIGVSSVIAMMALGTGAKSAALDQIRGFGANVITIFPNYRGSRGVRTMNLAPLTLEECRAIMAEVPLVRSLSPQISRGVQIKARGANDRTEMHGVAGTFLAIRNFEIASGRSFTESEESHRRKVVILGYKIVKDMMGGDADAVIGERISLDGTAYSVIGTLKEKGTQGFENQDNQVLVPYTTAMRRVAGTTNVGIIHASVEEEDDIEEAIRGITRVLRRHHKLTPDREDDFVVISSTDVLDSIGKMGAIFTLLISGIAGISLLVGGIGIMNIMLVTVTERTREIGIRKALGARRRDIMMQFLVESVVISLLGGAFGVSAGVAMAALADRSSDMISARITLDSISLSLGFCLFIGIFFGIYPARKAARLDPIEALRYE